MRLKHIIDRFQLIINRKMLKLVGWNVRETNVCIQKWLEGVRNDSGLIDPFSLRKTEKNNQTVSTEQPVLIFINHLNFG